MERVLLLNATYEPLALVSDRRAVVLMLAGRAESVAVRDGLQGVPLRPDADRRPLHRPPDAYGAHPALGPHASGDPSLRAPARRRIVRVLLAAGRHDRPRHPAQPRWHARVDQRGGRLQAGQSREGGPTALRTGVDDAGEAGATRTGISGGCGTSRTWIRCGSRIWLRPPSSICLPPRRSSPFYDVERFRSEPDRLAVVRAASQPTLVLGSTQPSDRGVGRGRRARPVSPSSVGAVAGERCCSNRATISGSTPGSLALIPSGWWTWRWRRNGPGPGGLPRWARSGVDGLTVHAGKSEPGPLGDLVCFAGRGPGEVFAGGRKLVGLSQWRAREGALFSSCLYTRWDPDPLTALLVAGEGGRGGLADSVPRRRGGDGRPGSRVGGGHEGVGRLAAALVRPTGLARSPSRASGSRLRDVRFDRGPSPASG